MRMMGSLCVTTSVALVRPRRACRSYSVLITAAWFAVSSAGVHSSSMSTRAPPREYPRDLRTLHLPTRDERAVLADGSVATLRERFDEVGDVEGLRCASNVSEREVRRR